MKTVLRSFAIDVLLESWPKTTKTETGTSVNQPEAGLGPPANPVAPPGEESLEKLYIICDKLHQRDSETFLDLKEKMVFRRRDDDSESGELWHKMGEVHIREKGI